MPQPTPIEVVKGFNAEWALGNIENAIAYIAEDAVYALHISGDVLSHGGEHVGRQKIATVLKKVREEFEYILYRPLQLTADGDTVRFQVEFMYRHRESGEKLEGRFRMVMVVKDGKLARTDEYHDRAKVEAFMRLFGRRPRE